MKKISVFLIILFSLPYYLFAASNTYTFDQAGDYVFDTDDIDVSSSLAQLVGTSNWYDTAWKNRRAVTIDNTGNATTFTDMQVLVNLTYDADMQSDFDDIRFTDSDGTTLLDFWIEEKTDSTSATIWVEVPSITGSASKDIYMYYGNAAASSVSSGDDTFEFFDDFISTPSNLFAFGSDSGWMSGFDPNTRRFYFFGASFNNQQDMDVTSWVNIDTKDVGFNYPPFGFSNSAVVWHPTDEKFYIYGGTDEAVKTNKIYSFDPATETLTLLAETLLDSIVVHAVVVDPTTDKVYIFGGRQSNTGSSQFINRIQVHNLDLETPTVTDTGADLPVGATGMGVIYSDYDNKIYLFGGAINNDTSVNSISDILVYDPSTPGVNPVDTGVDLETANDTMGYAYYNGYVYLFGGYNYTTTTYTDRIEKFDVANQTIETIAETMHKPDDDMVAFYDDVTGKIYIGPVLHSTASMNEDERKTVILEFDPDTETLSPEPGLGDVPTGWTSEGTATVDEPRLVGGTYMVLPDHVSDAFVAAKTSFDDLVGVKMIEFRTQTANSSGNMQFYLGPSNLGVPLLSTAAVSLRNRQTTSWNIATGASTDQAITTIPSDKHIIGAIVDVPNEKQYGLVDRSNKTSAIDWLNTGTLNTFFLNTSGPGVMATIVDWALIRNSTTGTEPTTTVGSEVTLYSTENPTIVPANPLIFTSLSGFSETATDNGGEIKYQLSNDNGDTWYWYNSGWTTTVSGYTEANTADTINSHIATLPVGDGAFLFKAYLNSDGSNLVQLDEIGITYENDTSMPVISNGSPSGSLTSGTTETTLSVITDENATCKYGTVAGTAYASIGSTFSTTGGTTHSVSIGGLANGQSYTYYVRCSDGADNVNTTDYSVSFSVTENESRTTSTGSYVALTRAPILKNNPILPPLDCPVLTSTMKKGSRYGEVEALQRILALLGHVLIADGLFGPVTDSAVREYQRNTFLDVDGIVGPITRASLFQSCTNRG